MRRKLAIIGIDGGTFKILNALIKMDIIPNIRYMVYNGYSAILKSTIPPTTVPAWYSLATGLNPGKLGFTSFFVYEAPNKKRLVTSNDIKGKAIWDFISSYGLKCAVINFPTYPPIPVNGYFITGMLTPSNENFTYPPEFRNVIRNYVGDYLVDVDHYEYANPKKILKICIKSIEQKSKLLDLLFREDYIDFLFLIFTETDRIQHLIWNKMEISKEQIKFSESKLEELFFDFWGKIDIIVGKILKKFDNAMIVSDHGFTALRGEFYINEWLLKNEYLKCREKPKETKHFISLEETKRALIKLGIFDYIVQILKMMIGKERLRKLQNKILPKEEIELSEIIDYKASKAFALEGESETCQIVINPNLNPTHKEKIKKEIIEKITRELNARGLMARVYTKEEVYKCSENLKIIIPDIVIYIHGWHIKPYIRGLPYLVEPDPRICGMHDEDGIFIAFGRDIKRGYSKKCFQIVDIAPTVLFMMNIPVPLSMDGKVLKEIFKEDSEYYTKKIVYRQDYQKRQLREVIHRLKREGKI